MLVERCCHGHHLQRVSFFQLVAVIVSKVLRVAVSDAEAALSTLTAATTPVGSFTDHHMT